MEKILIISTASLEDELRGASTRLKTLVKFAGNKSIFIFVPSILKRGRSYVNGISIEYFPISIYDFFMMPFYFFKGLPLSNIIFRRKNIKEKLRDFDFVIFHLIRTIHSYNNPHNKIIDLCESLSDNFLFRAKSIEKLSLKKFIFSYEAKRLKRFELEICNLEHEKKLFISKNDTLLDSCKNASILPNLPNFEINKNKSLSIDTNKTVFIGHVDYEPNLLSIEKTSHYLYSIDPKIKLHIVGRYNDKSKHYLRVRGCNNLIFYGFVEDIQPIFNEAVCGLAIINKCTGMQNKVLDYFSHSLPSIISSDVQSGLPGVSPALICDSVDDLKECIDLCTNEDKRTELINKGHDYIEKIYKTFKAIH